MASTVEWHNSRLRQPEIFMRAGQAVSLVLAMSLATVASAGDFDGSVPLTCTAEKAFDCLPDATSCGPLKPETNIEPVYGIDFARKEIRSPFRSSLLKVAKVSTNKDSLVLQGAEGTAAWSAFVDRITGALTVALADSKGAYVAFGQCKAAPAK
jgi:hypothetical protein